MNKKKLDLMVLRKLILLMLLASIFLQQQNAQAQSSETVSGLSRVELIKVFLKLCDTASEEILQHDALRNKKAFYIDSYIIRALAVAYDMTAKEKYLNACRQWSDKMITFQEKMIPRGIYYMNYGRRPFEKSGKCYSADNGCIAMGVLATAVRCKNVMEKERYVKSVEQFARLVERNFIGPNGGIVNAYWPIYKGEWWCSSGTVGALFFLLYKETGESEYLNAGVNDIRWLNAQNLDTIGPLTLAEQGPSLPMYVFEAYTTGLPYIMKDVSLRKAARKQFSWLLKWATAYDFKGKGQWESKYGGLPYHLLSLGKNTANSQMVKIGDKKLLEILPLVERDTEAVISQFCAFSLLSLAEAIVPNGICRSSRLAKAGLY